MISSKLSNNENQDSTGSDSDDSSSDSLEISSGVESSEEDYDLSDDDVPSPKRRKNAGGVAQPDTPSQAKESIDLNAWASLITADGNENIDTCQSLENIEISSSKSSSSEALKDSKVCSFEISVNVQASSETQEIPNFKLTFAESVDMSSLTMVIKDLANSNNCAQWCFSSIRTSLLNPRDPNKKHVIWYQGDTSHSFEMLRSMEFAKSGFVIEMGGKCLFVFPERIELSNRKIRFLGVVSSWTEIRETAMKSYLKLINIDKKLQLVLDLDSTLIWAISAEKEDTILPDQRKHYFRIRNSRYDMLVRFRPGVRRFLQLASSHFHLYVYTAAELEYARNILSHANREDWFVKQEHPSNCTIHIPLNRLFSSSRESSRVPRLKNLRNIFLRHHWDDLRGGSLIVDDIPESWAPENRDLIYKIPKYCGESKDSHLRDCIQWLVQSKQRFLSKLSENS